MKRTLYVHPSVLTRLRAMRKRGAEQALILKGIEQLRQDADFIEGLERNRLRADLMPLRKLRLGQLRIVYGYTDERVIVLDVGDRAAGRTPNFYDRLREEIANGKFATELAEIRWYARSMRERSERSKGYCDRCGFDLWDGACANPIYPSREEHDRNHPVRNAFCIECGESSTRPTIPEAYCPPGYTPSRADFCRCPNGPTRAAVDPPT